MKDTKAITSWAEDDRPREKLLMHGRNTLSIAELIAILLGSGNKEDSAVDLAKKILLHYDNSLNKLSRASAQELCKNFKGVGNAKAVTLLAAMELAVRKGLEKESAVVITSSQDAYQLIAHRLADLSHEEFWVLLLNNANKVITTNKLSMGGTKGTVVDKSMLLKLVVEHLASGIILAHNHPSGQKKTSQADRQITKDVKELCQLLDIRLLDHIIVCHTTYLSFADEGII
ncbi:DNA repair protein RadC [Balneicella halophila]|uniref:DNA repair protein RadC n=1 Tax=Balneicella halophila TaxID=1537566 RepID=A0A7L4US16_BALHA|nr:DNA repair protein RadC [Balneicella halophila]PVX52575.1 DNA repair protein RadC [Balneicella halophila]